MSKTSESKAGKKDEKKKRADKPKRVTGQNAGPQGFLVEHGEKAAFAAFGLIVILCALGALQHEAYTKTPDQLAASLQQKRQAVKQNTPESFEPLKKVEVVAYGERVGESVAPIPEDDRGSLFGVPNPELRIMSKRGEPEYRAVDNLQAYPLNEAFALLRVGAKKKEPAKDDPAKQPKAAPKKKDNLLGPGGMLGKGKGKKPAMPKELGAGAAKGPPDMMAGGNAPQAAPRGGVHAPDADAKAFPGVLIVGTIPRKKQADLYQKVFESARDYDPTRDTPHYVSFLMQRSKDGGQTWEDTVTLQTPKGPKVVSFLEAYWDLEKKFATEFPEIVDTSSGQYVVPFSMSEKKAKEGDESPPIPNGFTVSLPPILGRDWPEIVAGGFPVIRAEEQPGTGGHEGAPKAMGAGGANGPPGVGPQLGRPGGGQPGEAPGGPPQPGRPGGAIRKQVRGPAGGPMGAAAGLSKTGPGAAGAGSIGSGPIGRPPGAGPGAGGEASVNPFAPKKSNQPAGEGMGGGSRVQQDTNCDFLFRFFDFTAEEGQTYQYRIQLVLKNPNFDLAEGLLKDVRLRKDEYRYSAFSQPTAPVRISIAGSDVVAGPVRGARVEAGAADSATVILRQRHPQNGALLAHTFTRLEAGQLLNLKAQSVKYEKAVGGVEATPLPDFDFKSDEVLLDLKGSGDRGWPGEILLLDSNGRLSVKTEVPRADSTTNRAGGQGSSASGANGVHFASESKRLEYIYNHTAPATAGASGGQPSFEGLLKPKVQ